MIILRSQINEGLLREAFFCEQRISGKGAKEDREFKTKPETCNLNLS